MKQQAPSERKAKEDRLRLLLKSRVVGLVFLVRKTMTVRPFLQPETSHVETANWALAPRRVLWYFSARPKSLFKIPIRISDVRESLMRLFWIGIVDLVDA